MMGDGLGTYITKQKSEIKNNSFKIGKTKITSDPFFLKNKGGEKTKGDRVSIIAEISWVKQESKVLIWRFHKENSNFVV
jgi:hypothetical protein